jgi:hypothetical protein
LKIAASYSLPIFDVPQSIGEQSKQLDASNFVLQKAKIPDND